MAWAFVAVWMVGIVLASSIQGDTLAPGGLGGVDKLAHFITYTGLSFLLARAVAASGARRRMAWLVALGITSAFGALDETYQSTVRGRDPSYLDWLADAIGAVAGASLYVLLSLWWRSRQGAVDGDPE